MKYWLRLCYFKHILTMYWATFTTCWQGNALLTWHTGFVLCYSNDTLTMYIYSTVLFEWHTDSVLGFLNAILNMFCATCMTYWLCTVPLEWHTDYVLCYLNDYFSDIPTIHCVALFLVNTLWRLWRLQREMAAEQRLLAHQQESVKDSVQCELVCKEDAKRVDKMAEEERQYQVKLLLAMKDDAMVRQQWRQWLLL